jgi:hypothetical protein
MLIRVGALILILLLVACASGVSNSSGRMLQISGLLPNWDVDGMVQRADAVIIGAITKELGTKEIPGSLETVQFAYVFNDYEVAVERFLYPSEISSQQIAILTQAGPASKDSSVQVVVGEEKPEFKAGERILLFLESLQDPKFENTPGRPVPEGFTERNYYQVILSARYGKLVPADGKWRDSRTGIEVTVPEVEQAVDRQKANQP